MTTAVTIPDCHFPTFSTSSRASDFVPFLQYLNTCTTAVVCESPVAYKDGDTKTSWLNAVKSALDDGLCTANPDEFEYDWNNYDWATTVKHALRKYKAQAGTVFLFWLSTYGAPQLKALRAAHRSDLGADIPAYHLVAVHLRAGTLAIYDPSFKPKATSARFADTPNINLVKVFVTELKNNQRKVNRIFIGGGGNSSESDCAPMIQRWLWDELAVAKGENLHSWSERGFFELQS